MDGWEGGGREVVAGWVGEWFRVPTAFAAQTPGQPASQPRQLTVLRTSGDTAPIKAVPAANFPPSDSRITNLVDVWKACAVAASNCPLLLNAAIASTMFGCKGDVFTRGRHHRCLRGDLWQGSAPR